MAYEDFIFCNDPVCEADKAVDALEAKIKLLKREGHGFWAVYYLIILCVVVFYFF